MPFWTKVELVGVINVVAHDVSEFGNIDFLTQNHKLILRSIRLLLFRAASAPRSFCLIAHHDSKFFSRFINDFSFYLFDLFTILFVFNY